MVSFELIPEKEFRLKLGSKVRESLVDMAKTVGERHEEAFRQAGFEAKLFENEEDLEKLLKDPGYKVAASKAHASTEFMRRALGEILTAEAFLFNAHQQLYERPLSDVVVIPNGDSSASVIVPYECESKNKSAVFTVSNKGVNVKICCTENIYMEERSTNLYRLPVKKEDLQRVITKQGMLDEKDKSHVKNLKYSIDFLASEDTEVFAALDGEVKTVKDSSDVGGPDRKYLNDGNYVVIKHSNGEFTYYEHFRYKGITVKPGDKVKKGQLIGYVGMTGYTYKPHVHFEVFRWPSPKATVDQRETIRVRFENLPDVYEIGE